MNVVLWWFVLAGLAWLVTAWVLWKTNLVVSSGEGALDERNSDEREG